MANFKNYFDQLIEHEKGFVNDPDDPGGPTNLGITLATWKEYGKDLDGDGDIDVDDVKLITKPEAYPVYKKQYWDCLNLDNVRNQALAEIIFDHGVNAGRYRSARMVQYILKREFGYQIPEDGIIGIITVSLVNKCDPEKFFKAFWKMRQKYYLRRVGELATDDALIPFFTSIRLEPSLKAKKFKKGWLNRLNTFKYIA